MKQELGVGIRTMRREDLAQVLEIELACFTMPWTLATYRSLLERPDADLFIAEVDHDVAGYAAFWAVGDQGELGNIAVAEGYRQRGIGTALLEVVFRRAVERGVGEVFLEVRVSNEVAQKMYEQHGFERVGRRRGYYAAPLEDALVFCKRL